MTSALALWDSWDELQTHARAAAAEPPLGEPNGLQLL
jgi:hypothetical protein